MLFRRFYDDQLAQASYLLGCQATGEALVVDPNRHIEPYLRAAEAEGLRITHVTETHIHADFVSGARELAERTARVCCSRAKAATAWRYRYAAEAGADAAVRRRRSFEVGRVSVRGDAHARAHARAPDVRRHRYRRAPTEPMGAFTGDFLFVGDVGRPDLLERAAGQAGTMEAAARQLFRSLQRLGAAAGLPPGLARPRRRIGVRQGARRGAAVDARLRAPVQLGVRRAPTRTRSCGPCSPGSPSRRRYFAEMKRINRDGPRVLGGLARSAAGRRRRRGRGRSPPARSWWTPVPRASTSPRRVPGTINIPAGRAFTTWAGWLLPYDRDLHPGRGRPDRPRDGRPAARARRHRARSRGGRGRARGARRLARRAGTAADDRGHRPRRARRGGPRQGTLPCSTCALWPNGRPDTCRAR